MIDLRSDTVTLPTEEMRHAMALADVGDDVYGEDPSINRLEALSADRLGKEAGLFIPSGTMGNLIAFLTHCQRGEEAIMGDQAHTFYYEVGGVSALGGIMVHTVPNQADGTINLSDLQNAIRTEDVHFPTSRLIALENTHNRCGGVVLEPEYIQKVVMLAQENDLFVHMDGARIFNAAIKLGMPVHNLVDGVDSVTFCLSKGLGAPVGSVLCGTQDFIHRARRIRKQLGGGMRQAGILAAAGIVALETMVDRLEEDHQRAMLLADKMRYIPNIHVRENSPQTNMVFIDLADRDTRTNIQVIEELKNMGVLVGTSKNRGFRLVTHYGISDDDIVKVSDIFRKVMSI
ncbi:MAG: low-specificity L-threonine aldolase [Chloroflexi bacterium HGW-Chloroflexi-3]|nr:MAG: low-specificity L-threonine aldolase [Chloroflexi bacterium HGW-Chloroflexi-3]